MVAPFCSAELGVTRHLDRALLVPIERGASARLTILLGKGAALTFTPGFSFAKKPPSYEPNGQRATLWVGTRAKARLPSNLRRVSGPAGGLGSTLLRRGCLALEFFDCISVRLSATHGTSDRVRASKSGLNAPTPLKVCPAPAETAGRDPAQPSRAGCYRAVAVARAVGPRRISGPAGIAVRPPVHPPSVTVGPPVHPPSAPISNLSLSLIDA